MKPILSKPLVLFITTFFYLLNLTLYGQVVEVTATGYGTSPDNATKSAIRSAVEQVVGQLVDASLLVKNDEVVSDKILSYSGGYVDTFEVLKEPAKDREGLFVTKIKAKVKSTQLENKLTEVNVKTVKLSGNSVYGEMLSKQQEVNDAVAFISDVFLDLHSKMITAELIKKDDGRPDVEIDGSGKASANVLLQLNNDAYKTWVQNTVNKFNVIADDKRVNIVFTKREMNKLVVRWNTPTEVDASFTSSESRLVVMVITTLATDLSAGKMNVYAFKGEKCKLLRRYFTKLSKTRLRIEILMEDSKGNILGGGSNDYGMKYSQSCSILNYKYEYHNAPVTIYPFINYTPVEINSVYIGVNKYDGYKGLEDRVVVDIGNISPEQIRSAVAIKCRVKEKENSQ